MNRWSLPVLWLTMLGLFAAGVARAEAAAPSGPPDLTKQIDFERRGEYFLGPTGAKGWMYVNEHLMTDEARQILITQVAEGSPADGILQPGDVILGVGERRFQKDARKVLGRAIDEAEREENQGILRLIRWRPVAGAPTRQGREQIVEIRLPVLGTYSETAPYDCPKTERMLRRALDVLERRQDWGIFGIKALAFLATGEEKYIRLVHDYLHEVSWAKPDFKMSVESGGLVAWGAGYRNLVLTEYYLATGDRYVLPAIREHALKTAMGQSNGGTWGHGFAWTSLNGGRLHGRLGGYGAVNQAGLPCFLALVLSKKCGIEHPEIDDAIERARRFFRQFVGKGSIGYGYHRPSLEIHCNGRNGMSGNGKNGIAAVVFGLLGDSSAQQFFTMLTISTHNTCEYGHSGNSYSYFWDPLGANYGGPRAAAAFHKQLRWYYALTRMADGSFVNQPLGGYYGSGTLDATVAHVLMMASPRRAIYLTGKDEDRSLWLNDEQVEAAVEASRWRRANTDHLSADELIDKLDNWSPIAREWIAIALSKKEGDFVPRLLQLLESDKPEARAGACAALGYLGERAAEAVPAVAKALQDEEPIVRIAAGYALARMQTPARQAVPDLLQAVLSTREPGPMRPTQQALAYSLGYEPGKYAPLYFSGVLPNLSEKGDPLAGVDRQLVRRAVATLLEDPSARVRGCGAYALKFFTAEDLAALAGTIYDAILVPAPNYAMFDDAPRQHGLDLLARLGIEEGVSLCMETMEPDRWGHHVRVPHRLRTLQKYGAAARPLLPKLEELRWKVRPDYRALLEETIQTIARDQTSRPLVSLHTLADDYLAGQLAPIADSRQRVAACRQRAGNRAADPFHRAAALRELVRLLGVRAFDDIRAALGETHRELRKTAVQLGAQLPGKQPTQQWLDALAGARGLKAADILEVLALRAGSPALTTGKQRASILAAATDRLDDEPGVRLAAMRAVAAAGGRQELPRLIQALSGLPADDQAVCTAAGDVILGVCRSAGNTEQSVAELVAALNEAPVEARCVLLCVLGRLESDQAVKALAAAAADPQPTVAQAALEALALSPHPQATQMLLDMLHATDSRQLRGAVAAACLRRAVIGRVQRGRKPAVLSELLADKVLGGNTARAVAELAWVPSLEALELARPYLHQKNLAETAATAIVGIVTRLGVKDRRQTEAVREALEEVLKTSANEETLQRAETLRRQLDNPPPNAPAEPEPQA